MKKVSALLFCLLSASLTYAQAIEMTTIIPTTPSAVVDELRVLGSGTNSQVGTMNIGVSNTGLNVGANAPFQSQTLRATGANTAISDYVSADRDLMSNRSLTLSAVNVGNNGALFTGANSFPYVEAQTFRAKNISGPNSSSTIKTNALSGKSIEVDGSKIASPFAHGSVISKKKPVYIAVEQNTTNQPKQHIYGPWGELQATAPSGTKCNSGGNLCTKNACAQCTSNNATSCIDVRSRTLPDVYEAAGATFEKVATAKFYCKPSDVYDSNGNLTSTCGRYFVYSPFNGYTTEGFVSAANLPSFSNSAIQFNADPAENCAAVCGNTGCSTNGTYYLVVRVNGSTTGVMNFADAVGASCSTAASAWPGGSGLSCKEDEIVVDIYALNCYQGSGRLARAGGTWYQKRTVYCNKYDDVHGNEASNVSQIQDRYFFAPDFVVSFTAAYDSAIASEMHEAVAGGNHNNIAH